MRRLILDLSTSTGFAVFHDETLVASGVVALEKRAKDYADGCYPWSLVAATADLATKVLRLVQHYGPDEVVIEETNLGKANRYSQKLLEWIHHAVLLVLKELLPPQATVVYISSASWRKTLGIGVSKDQKKQNAKLSKLKSECRDHTGKLNLKLLNEKKKAAGIGGKITKKHAAIAYVNERLKLGLRPKDDDIADAIALGLARLAGAAICDGT